MPLEATGGAMMADLLVDKHISAVLDLSPFRKGERTRFATAFAEQLFHRKKTARTACHLFLEEAQAFLPQMVRGDDARMVGVFEDIGKVGRNYGIGVSILSQRPQAVNKDVLNQTEVLLAFQTNGPQERKTIGGWVVEHGNADVALVNALPTLPRGDAFVWSPQWLQIQRRVHVLARVTYDASSTPTQRAKQVRPKALTPADIQTLGEAMKATVERARADDPRELRKTIAEQGRELGLLKAELARGVQKQPPTVERVEVPALKDGQLARAEKLVADITATITATIEKADAVLHSKNKTLDVAWARLRSIADDITAAIGKTRQPNQMPQARAERNVPARRQAISPRRESQPVRIPGTVSRRGEADVPPAQQRVLNGLAFLHGIGVAPADKTQLALLVGVSPTSGGYFNNLGSLRSAGLIEYPSGGTVALTSAGEKLASTDGVPRTTDELHDAIRAKLPPAKWKILEALIETYPDPLEKDALAEQIGVSPTSGGFFNNLGSLRSLGLVDYPRPGTVAARSILFL